MASGNFAEMQAGAETQLRKRASLDELLQQAARALENKQYEEALRLHDQVSQSLPDEAPYANAGHDLRQQLIDMARACEARGKWKESARIWTALKAAGPGMAPRVMSQDTSQSLLGNTASQTLQQVKTAVEAGKYEEASRMIKNADASADQMEAMRSLLFETVRGRAQLAQTAGKWNEAKNLWTFLKKMKEE